jgi:hypothetical protein
MIPKSHLQRPSGLTDAFQSHGGMEQYLWDRLDKLSNGSFHGTSQGPLCVYRDTNLEYVEKWDHLARPLSQPLECTVLPNAKFGSTCIDAHPRVTAAGQSQEFRKNKELGTYSCSGLNFPAKRRRLAFGRSATAGVAAKARSGVLAKTFT